MLARTLLGMTRRAAFPAMTTTITSTSTTAPAGVPDPAHAGVPDPAHAGVGAIDEGVDGLREAGVLDDAIARSLAQEVAQSPLPAQHQSALAAHANTPDGGAANVYAIDDNYKEIAFTILEMTERDFAGTLAHALRGAAHDASDSPLSDSASAAELFTNIAGEMPVESAMHMDVEPDMAAALMENTAHSAACPPEPHSHQAAEPVGSAPQATTETLAEEQTAWRVHSHMATAAAANNPILMPKRFLTLSTAVREYLDELETGRIPAHYDHLRMILAQAKGKMYRADPMCLDDRHTPRAEHTDEAADGSELNGYAY